jgi:hypothetical protein
MGMLKYFVTDVDATQQCYKAIFPLGEYVALMRSLCNEEPSTKNGSFISTCTLPCLTKIT